jgi:peptide/nickel transport system substrate-binding protein
MRTISWRRHGALALLLALLIPILAACGGAAPAAAPSEQPTAAQAAAPTTAPEPTAAPAAEPTAAPAEPTAAGAPTSAPAAGSNGGLTQANGLSVASVTSCDAPYAGLIKEIAAVDPLTVRFTMCSPDPAFQAKVAFSSFGIEPSEYFEKTGGTGDLLEKPIGTGPYMLDSWTKGDNITFKRNDNYWGDKAKAATLVFRWSTEAAQRLLELQSGTVDAIDNVAPDDFEKVKSDSTLQLFERPALNVFYLGMSNAYKPFDNEKVRQAITYAIPYKKLLTDVMHEQASPMRSAVPSSMPGFTDEGNSAEYNLEKAKQLLAEAGYPKGFTFDFTLGSGFPDWNDDAVLIQAELAKIGVTMNIHNMARAQFLDALAGKKVQSYISRWTSFVNDPGYHLGLLLTSKGSSDYNNYSNAQVDQLWDEAAKTSDDAARTKLYEQMQQIINEESPWAYLYEYNIVVTHRDDVQGYTSYPDALIRFFQLSKTK